MSVPTSNTQVLFKEDPGAALVQTSHMEVVTVPFASPELAEGEVLVKNLYISLDPYMRGRMNTRVKSYSASFELGKVMQAGGVSQVLASRRDGFAVGDIVSTFVGWEEVTLVPAALPLRKIDSAVPVPLSYYLGVLGMVGATAYHGLLDLCSPKAGETLFVSGAAGAVGLVVGQIAKIKGLRVVGSAGSDEKVALLKSQFGFDEAFNYKTVPSISEALGAAAPKGVDVYFDNVGGEHLDAALAHINVHGRIAACGMISGYNGQQYTFKNLTNIIGRQVKIEGFIIGGKLADPEFTARFGGDVGKWVLEGKLKYAEHVVEGIAKAPEAFVGLFKGDNTGKLIIKV
ncbi:hypothetical protein HK105_200551 [Polyrhizophydium stewartii]|uniref:Enoyl reductase (ER) domain-containing protein n=1 Tax=Polyrhizophydium stewartii TaxID=2732419 RepID=A0ABR4NJC5_9FUNG